MEEEEITAGYKATDKNMQCQGYQYVVGGEYNHPGELKLCPTDSELGKGKGGFHFCVNPLDILDYYNLCDSEFHTVESQGKTDGDGKKSVTKNLKLTETIGLTGFVKASVEYLRKVCTEENSTEVNNDDSAKLAASGYYSKLAASGYCSQLAASGDSAKLAASGDGAQLAASGYCSQLAASGDDCVIAGIGIENSAKGKKGNWITLAEWKYDYEIKRWTPLCVKSARIDGKRIKEDIYYKLIGGKFVESGE